MSNSKKNNKAQNDGKKLESTTKTVFDVLSARDLDTTVSLDVKLEGIDGNRQIDVLLESRLAGLNIRTIVECKDHKRPVDIMQIDALHSKMQDVNADKAVLVSRKGFSKTAIHKANRLGITLCTLDNPTDELKDVGLEIPITIKEVLVEFIHPKISAIVPAKSSITLSQTSGRSINDIDIRKAIETSLLNQEIAVPDGIDRIVDWQLKNVSKPYFIRDVNGEKVDVQDYSLDFDLKISYYFGYVSELNNSILFRNLTSKEDSLIYSDVDLADYKTQLQEFSSFEQIPQKNSRISIVGIAIPETITILEGFLPPSNLT